MAWYPGATRMELQPESDQQAAIDPTQFIMHSIAAPWDERRIYEYWRDSTNLESHFGLDFDGSLGQFIGTETKADANYSANLRADGTGAVSIETASNLEHTDPWTVAQMTELIDLGVWLHKTHGIPLRICRSWTDPGFGYHALYPQWAKNGTACPGAARIKQFREVVFPGIVARATGKATTPTEEDDMEPVDIWGYKGKLGTKPDPRDAYAYLRDTETRARRIEERLAKAEQIALTDAQVASLADKVAANPTLANRIAELVADKLAARLAD
ncbi:N-acetylmuramoyl-L-alanine amidase [Streptomyces sp. CS081A]|uniref:peptidoglycan recognition protein family protein n=1 Tax=Streptomyces sp. CS081A TaxID=2162709 RepID=UPI000D513B6C|nr:N-acetylmuramoyl-L-alanine amidase [Streptomyces sp. CS081A]PVC73459.1 hypothetical protein DBP18_14000 [Streptomyces sp. CS081A]